ncbi:hypothetical protein RDI58_024626 [Solanum bulbocastanum]|uniref:Uncharacterized protein n=1 Tax=Solanum bulbocastanum TaxID=147425 RepID=A0AAN8T5A3_SOLBU
MMKLILSTYAVSSVNGSCPLNPGRVSTIKCDETTSDTRSCSRITMIHTIGVEWNCENEAKPATIFFGAKRKAITLIEEVVDKPSLSSAVVKNVTE